MAQTRTADEDDHWRVLRVTHLCQRSFPAGVRGTSGATGASGATSAAESWWKLVEAGGSWWKGVCQVTLAGFQCGSARHVTLRGVRCLSYIHVGVEVISTWVYKYSPMRILVHMHAQAGGRGGN
eukprot:352603-Chlamydomonas_euryale.AAC.2